MKSARILNVLLSFGLSVSLATALEAQQSTVLTSDNFPSAKGLVKDGQDRAPNISMSWGPGIENSTAIHVSVNHPEGGPYKVEIYINSKLFVTQVSTPELPSTFGANIGPDVGFPFTATVVAERLTANRAFRSMAQAAIYSSYLSALMDTCKFTPTADSITSTVEQTEVQTNQVGNDTMQVSLKDGDASVTANLVLTPKDDDSEAETTVVASIQYLDENGISVGLSGEGTITFQTSDKRKVTGVNVTTSEGATLVCENDTIQIDS